MLKHAPIVAAAIAAVIIASAADARPRTTAPRATITCDRLGCSDQPSPQQPRTSRTSQTHVRERIATVAIDNTVVIGGRPAGCPHQYCGCEASRYVFGTIRPELNLASNWIKYFSRSSPASGMVAARTSHVMVLVQQVDGDNWLVHDGNSGGGLTRRHVRSISGYVIVDPHAMKVAALPSERAAAPRRTARNSGLSRTADSSPAIATVY